MQPFVRVLPLSKKAPKVQDEFELHFLGLDSSLTSDLPLADGRRLGNLCPSVDKTKPTLAFSNHSQTPDCEKYLKKK